MRNGVEPFPTSYRITPAIIEKSKYSHLGLSVHIHPIVIIPDNPTEKLSHSLCFSRDPAPFGGVIIASLFPVGVFACTSRNAPVSMFFGCNSSFSCQGAVGRTLRTSFVFAILNKSEEFHFVFHILRTGKNEIGHDFRNFLKKI